MRQWVDNCLQPAAWSGGEDEAAGDEEKEASSTRMPQAVCEVGERKEGQTEKGKPRGASLQ